MLIEYKKIKNDPSLKHFDETDFTVIDETNSSPGDTAKRFKVGWSSAEEHGTVCGMGSTKENTANVLKSLPYVFKSINAKKVNDAGCGDFAWVKHADLKGIDYMGYDVAEWAEQDEFKFKKLDVINQKMRKADLIICRDVFFHIPNNLIIKAIKNMKASKTPYLLCSSAYIAPYDHGDMTLGEPEHDGLKIFNNESREKFQWTKDGEDLVASFGLNSSRTSVPFCTVNLEAPPFNFPDPILSITERDQNNRFLGLWNLKDISLD